jgi:hypothetical protein
MAVPMRADRIERKLARIERAANDVLEQLQQLRVELGRGESQGAMWRRMLHQVLDEIDKAGGEVPRKRVVEIGVAAGYDAHGLAGFYQQLLTLDENDVAHLTDKGRERLAQLRKQVAA